MEKANSAASILKSQVSSGEYFRHFKSHVFVQISAIMFVYPDLRRPGRNHGSDLIWLQSIHCT